MGLAKKKKKRGIEESRKEPPLPGEGEVLCGVIRLVGGDHLIVKCLDGEERMVRIPGRMRRRVWMREGDIVLVAPWDFNPKKGDIIYRYDRGEVAKLIEKGVLPREFLDALSELI